MTAAAADCIVAFHYKVATAEGEHIDASQQGEPLLALIGHGNIIPGLERQLVGKRAGDRFTATIPPGEAYGEHDPRLDLDVPRSNFPANVRAKLQPGMRFTAPHPGDDSAEAMFTIIAVGDATVRVSGNHELAGKTLVFSIEVAEVRPASAEELAHGHAHGPGGHHHH